MIFADFCMDVQAREAIAQLPEDAELMLELPENLE